LTGKYEFISNIINFSFHIEEYKSKVKSLFKDKKIIVYGAGEVGGNFARICDGIEISAFCDSAKHGEEVLGYKVISPTELKENYSDHTVIIAVFDYKDALEITEKIISLGISRENIINISKAINLVDILRSAYFSPDIILPLITNDEVFIDAGCYDFKTSLRFAEYCGGKYKKIIAFEPCPDNYRKCLENSKAVNNATVYQYGLWDENTELSFKNISSPEGSCISNAGASDIEKTIEIKTARLDDILNGEKATFIKMDIEGAELNALKGAEQTILKYRPKLAICIYHKPEDIWEIPAYILSLHKDYNFYLRHYSLYAGETVLYAV
jgi:FkbM family methyltransferase